MSEPFVAYVRFRLPDGRSQRVTAGSLIGRASRAELCLKSPDISEAHALISLRGRTLYLLALRRWVALSGVPQQEVALAPGQRILLSSTVVLEVEQVEVPTHELVLMCDATFVCTISESVLSIGIEGDELFVINEYSHGATAWIFSDAESLLLKIGDKTPQKIEPGVVFEIGGSLFTVVIRARQGVPSTGPNGIFPPMRIKIRHDSVLIESPRNPPLVLSGKRAELVIHLARLGRATEWHYIAEAIWPKDKDDPLTLRNRWDRQKSALHTELRTASLRPDLVYADGCGNVELKLHSEDELIFED